MQALETLPISDWRGPFDAALRGHAVDALEAGRVVFLPRLPFALNEAEGKLLAEAAAGELSSKNVSFDPKTGRCKGAAFDPATEAAMASLLRRFGDAARALVLGLAPGYEPGLEQARASFRPAEVDGRALPWRKDDRRKHVDAFPSRPTCGRRILRVFSNIDPAGGVRRWRVGEPFEDHASRFLPRLRAAPPGQSALLAMLGVTHGKRTAYDELMLGLHDAAKRDEAYQTAAPDELIEFPAGSTWLVFTDAAPHAALGGRYALEQTFHLDPAAMAQPARAPIAILERLTGRALA